MEYLLYIFLVVTIGLGCAVLVRLVPRLRNRNRKRDPGRPASAATRRTNRPGSRTEARLQQWLRRVSRRRQVSGDLSQDPRFRRSVRALLEDRYGRVRDDSMTEMRYLKEKPPRLRDPRAPHDQMDQFGTGEAEGLKRRLPAARIERVGASAHRRTRELKDVKQPWGW